MVNKVSKSPGKWKRRGRRCKFIVASVSPQELEIAHTLASAMGVTISGMLRQLVLDNYYLLQSGENYQSPIEACLDLTSEVQA
jgi:hypothetical protein